MYIIVHERFGFAKMSPETIRERATAVRLSQKMLGQLSGMSEKFVSMTLLAKSRPRYDNLQSLESVVLAEELRLRDYLLTLHPLAPNGGEGRP